MFQEPITPVSEVGPSHNSGLRNAIALAPALIGAAVMLGWTFDIPALKTVLPGLSSIKANTALAFITAGTGLLLVPEAMEQTAYSALRKNLASACAIITLLLGVVTLFEYGFGASLGIDELLIADPNTTSPPYPGRMAPATAACFAFVGAAILLLARASVASNMARRCASTAHILVLVPTAVGYLALAGYAYDVKGFYTFGPFVSVTLHTALAFMLLAFAVQLTLPDLGWRGFFASNPVALGVFKRLLLISLLAPFAAGAVVVWGAKGHYYDPLFGPALLALAAAATATVSSWFAVGVVRRAETNLARSEQLFRELFEAMPQMAFVAQADGGNLFHNRRWSEYAGISQAEGVGERWADTVHPKDLERTRAAWTSSLATGTTCNIEHRLRDAAGEYRWFLTRAVALFDHETKNISRWIGTSTDISEIVAARQTLAQSRDDLELQVANRTRELQEARERLAHAQRIEALGQLSGGIAHDFNNILQAVMGGAATIKRRAGDAEQVVKLAQMVCEAADRGAAITRRLLAFARQDNLKAEPVFPESLLAGMQEILNHTLGAGIVVKLDVAPGVPALLANRRQLETVLINLAKNASDAMNGAGALCLSAVKETVLADEPPSYPVALAVGPYVRLSVSDTGIGINPELLARVVEPFFTTKEVGKGTGLGLSMAHGFAKQSGGELHIESAPGRGTVVMLWLPAVTNEAVSAVVSSDSKTAAVSAERPARVLIVDDDAAVPMALVQQIEAEGYSVLSAASGTKALAMLDRGEAVDLVVADLSMPGVDGERLINEACRRSPLLPAILLTGFAPNAETAMDSAFIVLGKPIEGRILAQWMALLLNDTSCGIMAPD